ADETMRSVWTIARVADERVRETSPFDHFVGQILVVGAATGALDDVRQQDITGTAVRPALAGREQVACREELDLGRCFHRSRRIDLVVLPVPETGRVGEELVDCDLSPDWREVAEPSIKCPV